MIVVGDVIKFCENYNGQPFHACFSDPPYELGFMGKDWDRSGVSFSPDTWRAFASCLYPGAFLFAFASSRGWHRQAVAMEDAGLVFHPSVFLLGGGYGQGFPKASPVGEQIDKAAGAVRERVVDPKREGKHLNLETSEWGHLQSTRSAGQPLERGIPATELAKSWEGYRYGLQCLKPALEPILVAQKPYKGKAVDCMVETGAGALDIDSGRIPTLDRLGGGGAGKGLLTSTRSSGWGRPWMEREEDRTAAVERSKENVTKAEDLGRWPANLILQHHPECGEECHPDCAVKHLDDANGEHTSGEIHVVTKEHTNWSGGWSGNATYNAPKTSGGVSRFFTQVESRMDEADPLFYCAKASQSERNAGLEGRCPHPTVKPLGLCRHLSTLLLPPEEYRPRRVFVPFSGVGSEMIGSIQSGWETVYGIEQSMEYATIAAQRIKHWTGLDEYVCQSEEVEEDW